MQRIQARIGWTLGLFSLALIIIKTILYLSVNQLQTKAYTMEYIMYFVYTIIFILSAVWYVPIMRVAQVTVIFYEAIITTCAMPYNSFFGLAMFIMGILLLYAYRFFARRMIAKLISCAAILYGVFVCIPGSDSINAYIRGAERIAFIGVFLFMVWLIFKDKLEYIEDREKKGLNKAIMVAEEAAEIAREALSLEKECEKEK